MGRKAHKRIAYFCGSYVLLPLDPEKPGELTRVPPQVFLRSCARCGALEAEPCKEQGRTVRHVHGQRNSGRTGTPRNWESIYAVCERLVATKRFDEIQVLAPRALFFSQIE